jgi:hypothetical protein
MQHVHPTGQLTTSVNQHLSHQHLDYSGVHPPFRPFPFVCPQEPHKHQVEFLAAQLPGYAWVGKGRCPVVFGIGEEVRGSVKEVGGGGGLLDTLQLQMLCHQPSIMPQLQQYLVALAVPC